MPYGTERETYAVIGCQWHPLPGMTEHHYGIQEELLQDSACLSNCSLQISRERTSPRSYMMQWNQGSIFQENFQCPPSVPGHMALTTAEGQSVSVASDSQDRTTCPVALLRICFWHFSCFCQTSNVLWPSFKFFILKKCQTYREVAKIIQWFWIHPLLTFFCICFASPSLSININIFSQNPLRISCRHHDPLHPSILSHPRPKNKDFSFRNHSAMTKLWKFNMDAILGSDRVIFTFCQLLMGNNSEKPSWFMFQCRHIHCL